MNVDDSSGWLEYFTRGKNGPLFLAVIQDTQNLLVPTVVISEVCKRVATLMGIETALDVTGVMSSGYEAALDRKIALEAAQVSVDYGLAMADSIILATARAYDAILWNQDAHFKDIEGVRYVAKEA